VASAWRFALMAPWKFAERKRGERCMWSMWPARDAACAPPPAISMLWALIRIQASRLKPRSMRFWIDDCSDCWLMIVWIVDWWLFGLLIGDWWELNSDELKNRTKSFAHRCVKLALGVRIDDWWLAIDDWWELNSRELKNRTKTFAHRCVKLALELPRVFWEII